MVKDHPMKKDRELTAEEKERIRQKIRELEGKEDDQTISDKLSDEFGCSPSQIAGIYAHM